MYEEDDPLDVEMFVDNSERILRQMETPIHVLVGNPPWSAGQNSANENNANDNCQNQANGPGCGILTLCCQKRDQKKEQD